MLQPGLTGEGKRTGATRAGWALTLLFLAIAINVLDRQIINILAQDIKTELVISDAELGLLTGTAFGIFYSVMGIPLGRLADRMNRVHLVSIALVIWSGFTAASGWARNFLELGLARTGVGVGEAGCVPASVALVSDIYPEDKRTSAISLMMLGMPVGIIVGLLAGGLVGSYFGWRMAFFLAGIPGLVLAVVLFMTVQDPRATDAQAAGDVAKGSIFQAAKILMRQRSFALVIAGNCCSMLLAAISGAWLPTFLIRAHGMSLAEVGVLSAFAIGVSGAVGTLGAGFLCDKLRPHVRDVESKLLIAALTLSIPTLLATVLLPGKTMAIAAMFLLNIFVFAYLSPSSALIQRAATADTRSLAIGLAISFGNILSLGLAIPAVGALSDSLTPDFGERAIGYALLSAILACVLGAVAHSFAIRALRAREASGEFARIDSGS